MDGHRKTYRVQGDSMNLLVFLHMKPRFHHPLLARCDWAIHRHLCGVALKTSKLKAFFCISRAPVSISWTHLAQNVWQPSLTVIISLRTKPKNYTPWLRSASELHRPSDRRMSAKLVQLLQIDGDAWSAQRIPTAVNLGFLDPTRREQFEKFVEIHTKFLKLWSAVLHEFFSLHIEVTIKLSTTSPFNANIYPPIFEHSTPLSHISLTHHTLAVIRA
jgi:hypothetical protein